LDLAHNFFLKNLPLTPLKRGIKVPLLVERGIEGDFK
jgi:hypothetical protein